MYEMNDEHDEQNERLFLKAAESGRFVFFRKIKYFKRN